MQVSLLLLTSVRARPGAAGWGPVTPNHRLGMSWGCSAMMKECVDVEVMEAAKLQQSQSLGLKSIVQQLLFITNGYPCQGFLTTAPNRSLCLHMSNPRPENHKLQTKTARWSKFPILAQEHYSCRLCSVEDATGGHVLLHCPFHDINRSSPDVGSVSLYFSCQWIHSGFRLKYVAACLAARNDVLSRCDRQNQLQCS